MDSRTLKAYAEKAKTFSEDWLQQPEPSDMYQLLNKFFIPHGKTADIGCGNGRDAHWLQRNGFQVEGFDSSTELLSLATQNFPEVKFQQSFLPELKEVTETYDNVLCETVIMHLPKTQIPTAIENIKRITKRDGILYLSWRVTEGNDARHEDGRLYSAFSPEFILDQFPRKNILHFEDQISASSKKRVCRLIYKNN